MENVNIIGGNQVKCINPSLNRSTFSEIKDEKITTATLVSQATLTNSSGSTANGNNNSPKMGSRRIFTPQFKLQVLESYRNDSDCKGNQRATARKYNIHRRQIQKWLQCESSLRSSVANINHNTVKHQFHNINMQQTQTQKNSIPANSCVSGSYGPSHPHSTHLSIDATIPMLVPSLATAGTAASSQKQGVLAAANLAAAVAAVTGSSGAMTIPSTIPSTITSAPTKAVISPLRPSAIIGASRNTSATMSPLLHHHHYGMPSYSHTPVGVPLSVPILTHHISHPQHIHQQTQQPQQTYQYHNLAYTQTLEKQRSYLSSISLPTVNTLTTAAVASTPNGFAIDEFEQPDGRDVLQLRINTSSEDLAEINGYVYRDEHKNTYAECSRSIIKDTKHANEQFSVFCQFNNDGYPLVYPLGPMDLSLRPRRVVETELLTNSKSNVHSFKTKQSEMSVQKDFNDESNIVDLTYRKRKVASTRSADELKLKLPEKQSKLEHSSDNESYNCNAYSTTEMYINNLTNSENCNEEDDTEIDIEVGTEEKIPPSKPVKLFKPYLLDGYEDNDNNVNNSNKCMENEHTEFNDKNKCNIFPNVPSVSPSQCYSETAAESLQENTFQVSLADNNLSTNESSNFLAELKTGSPQSALSLATTVPTLSPTTFQCPKGSPTSSGYESSTSTYSESSLSSRSDNYAFGQTYSINLQMHSIYNDNIVLYPSKHVQRWLDQEESNLPATNSSIALFV